MKNTDGKTKTVIITIVILSLLLAGVIGIIIYMMIYTDTMKKSKIHWLAVGDSVTVGNADGSYAEYIARSNKNIILTNRSWGGVGVRELNNITNEDFLRDVGRPDIVTVLIGTNDFGFDKPMEEFENSLATYISTLKADFPESRIVFLTPLYRDYFSDDIPTVKGIVNNLGLTLYNYRDSMIRVCKSNNVEVIDLTNDNYINKDNLRQLTLDGLHPNSDGHKMIAKKLKVELGF